MIPMALAFDVGLCATILWLSWMALAGRHIFRSIVFFISVGLLMALAWVRMSAPDLGMAEAAVGAGITGVLLLDTLGRIASRRRRGHRDPDDGHG